MKYFDWSEKKNNLLKEERNISFEDILIKIDQGGLLNIVKHHNQKRYKNQKIFIVNVDDYAYLVPFIEDDKKVFFKTIVPSRKATKKYIIRRKK